MVVGPDVPLLHFLAQKRCAFGLKFQRLQRNTLATSITLGSVKQNNCLRPTVVQHSMEFSRNLLDDS